MSQTALARSAREVMTCMYKEPMSPSKSTNYTDSPRVLHASAACFSFPVPPPTTRSVLGPSDDPPETPPQLLCFSCHLQ